MLLLIDNFDSFTYNLVQQFQALGKEIEVARNDAISVHSCLEKSPSHIIISPGPGWPEEAGISQNLIKICSEKRIPLLGVCLGHQCIAKVFGADIRRAKVPMHGKISTIKHNGKKLFAHLPDFFLAARYHSLAVEPTSLPASLEIDAEAEDGEIMAISHKTLPLYGVQFHPESIATQHGAELLLNFLKVPYV